ncbi:hypothetical protein DL93DRAFT_2104111 [Clavulina sp. PMI_390]|nr:hypothetical protein DL93DRAFT_2104111 [Clavulina sp. PMI_390]
MLVAVEVEAPAGVLTLTRICLAWAIIRLRSPLASSSVEMPPGQYASASFLYTPPRSPKAALDNAMRNLKLLHGISVADEMERFSSSPPVLSPTKLSQLTIIRTSSPPTSTSSNNAATERVWLLLSAVHYATSISANHSALNDMLILLGNSGRRASTDWDAPSASIDDLDQTEHLSRLLVKEWHALWGNDTLLSPANGLLLPPAESAFGCPSNLFQAAAHSIHHEMRLSRDIGSHVFPRPKAATRNDDVWKVTFSRDLTKRALARCKNQRVTLSNAVFAATNFAWIRAQRILREREGRGHDRDHEKSPMLLYSAINVGPVVRREEPFSQSTPHNHFHLALAYLNLVLPAFLPRTPSANVQRNSELEEAIFWHRARTVKRDTASFINHKLLGARVLSSYKDRVARAIRFAQEDDQAVAAAGHGLPPSLAPAPSAALIGLSLIGDLDKLYRRAEYGPIQLLDCIPTYRKNKGGILVYCRSFLECMTVGLILDVGGLEKDLLDEFWKQFQRCIREYVVGIDGSGSDELPRYGGVSAQL